MRYCVLLALMAMLAGCGDGGPPTMSTLAPHLARAGFRPTREASRFSVAPGSQIAGFVTVESIGPQQVIVQISAPHFVIDHAQAVRDIFDGASNETATVRVQHNAAVRHLRQALEKSGRWNVQQHAPTPADAASGIDYTITLTPAP